MTSRGARRSAVVIALAVCVVLLAAAPALADNSLVGEWHMDQLSIAGEGIYSTPDDSGNGNDLSGNDGTQVAGKWGDAIAFDANQFDELSAPAGAPALEQSQLTVMAWVKAAASPGPNAIIIAQGGSPGCSPSSYALTSGGDGGLQFQIYDGMSVSPSADPGPGIWDGAWHFVVGTYDGQTVRLYVDGTEVTPGFASSTTIDYRLPNNTFTLGGYPDPNCKQFAFYSGALDEARVYDRALSADEISQLQAASGGNSPPELGGPPPPPPPTTTTTTPPPTTTTTSTAAPPPPPPPVQPPVARFSFAGASGKLKGAAWFDGASSHAFGPRTIVSYAWDPTGSGTYSDPCGKSPIASLVFHSVGLHTVGLKVTDSAGAVATTRLTIRVSATMVDRLLGSQTVFDCENPAAGGEQASTADCIKTFAWSIIDVNSRGAPNDCFLVQARFRPGVFSIAPLLASDPAARTAISLPAALKNALYLYHATVSGPVALNGLYIPVPEGVKTVYDTGDGTIGLGRLDLRLGPFGTQTLDLSEHITLTNLFPGDCYTHPTQGFRLVPSGLLSGGTKIGGLPIQGGVAIDLLDHSSRATFKVGLPNIFGFAPGQPAQGTLCLNSDNVNGASFEGMTLAVPNAFIGPFPVQNLSFNFQQDGDIWSGGATVTLPGSGIGLDASPPPPDLGFGIRGGQFDHAGIGVDFGPAGPELFPGVILTNIHVAFGVDPIRFTGGIGLTAAQILDINGDVFVAAANPDQPYYFPATGGDLSPLSGRSLISTTVAVGGNATLHVPVVGQLPVANAYLLYEYPDYFEFGGGFELDPPLLKITGSLGGFLDPQNSTFNLQASVAACLRDAISVGIGPVNIDIKPCFSTGAVISSNGVGFCGTIPVPFPITGVVPVTVTVGYHWGDSLPSFGFFSCDIGSYSVQSTHTAHDAAGPGFTLPAGLAAATVRLTGAGGAPDVIITAPGGHSFSTAGATGSNDLLVVRIPAADETLVAVRHPLPGRWTLAPAGVSTPVTSVAVAQALPPPAISARVIARGANRVLRYRVTLTPGRQITFVERGAGVNHVLGRALRHVGALVFRPAPGTAGNRQIMAMITQNGTPVRDIPVTSYRAPRSPRLPSPHLTLIRTRRSLTVRWSPVPRAWRYAVTVTLPSHHRVFRLIRGRAVTFTIVDRRTHVRVQVLAIEADGRRGALSSAIS